MATSASSSKVIFWNSYFVGLWNSVTEAFLERTAKELQWVADEKEDFVTLLENICVWRVKSCHYDI